MNSRFRMIFANFTKFPCMIRFCARFVQVGRMLWQARQPKTLILFGTFSFHKVFHTLPPNTPLELSEHFSSFAICLATLFPDLTEYSPFLLWSQNIEFGMYLWLSGTHKIASASSWLKFCRVKPLFHHYESESISLKTIISSSIFNNGCRNLFVEWLRIQLSFRIWIEAPLPTLQHEPLYRIGLAAVMLFNTKEILGKSVASKKWYLRKYWAVKHRNSRDSWSCINLQHCFANIARLNFHKSLKPIPPNDFGIVSLSQLNQWIFLSFPTWPHQNRAHIDWSSSHNFIDSWNTHIIYVGIDCAIALISISFLALDNNFPFHP